MNSRERKWCWWMAVVAVLNLLLPFGPLRDRGSLYGSFAFWLILTVAVIFSGAVYTVDWGRQKGRS
nr:hypothetical protein [uncultured Dethiosulfovibrio sp.]